MKTELTMIAAITLAIWLAAFCSSGCTPRPMPPTNLVVVITEVHVPSESWDQDNLKRNDAGCPTAIYDVSPDGLLELCPLGY
jgi:hypothetical protein